MKPEEVKKIARIEVRVSPEVKNDFSLYCQEQGNTTSEAIRNFVNQSLYKNKTGLQPKIIYSLMAILISITIGSLIYFFTPKTHPEKIYKPSEIAKLEFVFATFDINKDGVLTLYDYQEQYRIVMAKGNENNIFGRPHDKQKFAKQFNPKAQFLTFDSNKDAQITIDEFIEVSQKRKLTTRKAFSSSNS